MSSEVMVTVMLSVNWQLSFHSSRPSVLNCHSLMATKTRLTSTTTTTKTCNKYQKPCEHLSTRLTDRFCKVKGFRTVPIVPKYTIPNSCIHVQSPRRAQQCTMRNPGQLGQLIRNQAVHGAISEQL